MEPATFIFRRYSEQAVHEVELEASSISEAFRIFTERTGNDPDDYKISLKESSN